MRHVICERAFNAACWCETENMRASFSRRASACVVCIDSCFLIFCNGNLLISFVFRFDLIILRFFRLVSLRLSRTRLTSSASKLSSRGVEVRNHQQ